MLPRGEEPVDECDRQDLDPLRLQSGEGRVHRTGQLRLYPREWSNDWDKGDNGRSPGLCSFAATQSGEGTSGVSFNRVKGGTDGLRSILSLKPANREVASAHLLKVIDEEQIDKGSASSANDRNRLRGDLL